MTYEFEMAERMSTGNNAKAEKNVENLLEILVLIPRILFLEKIGIVKHSSQNWENLIHSC